MRNQRIWIFHAVAFLGAFLLFQIQPMTSKALLPAFGGSYLVWGACMVFYQAVLLLGYAYAHIIQRRLGVFRYSRFHWILLLLPLVVALSPCVPSGLAPLAQTHAGSSLVWSVLLDLFKAVGLPALVLSTTSLVLQRWLSLSELPEKDNPYVLYAASNLGSILGLLSYPVITEPLLNLAKQWQLWWVGYFVMISLQLRCLPLHTDVRTEGSGEKERVPVRNMAAWFLPGLAGSAMLLAVTNVITLDIASAPFLWALPLSVYLLSFVLTFKRNPWCPARVMKLVCLAVTVGVLLHLMGQLRLSLPVVASLSLHLIILFLLCLACNRELIRSKPVNPEHLTMFYLAIAAGGLAGSIFVGWIVPVISRSLVEYPLSLVLIVTSLAFSRRLANDRRECATLEKIGRIGGFELAVWLVAVALSLTLLPWLAGRFLDISVTRYGSIIMAIIAVPVAIALLRVFINPWQFAIVLTAVAVASAWTEDLSAGAGSVRKYRNFYGIYKVFDAGGLRFLKHGTTLHGRQYLNGAESEVPLSYYHPTTPGAQVLNSANFHFSRIGMIGLGTGALAAYAHDGQTFTIFELDPDNLPIARDNFTYLDIGARKGARLNFAFGDGRTSLRAMKNDSLDLLIIDAFNSGSIPVHLLTVEAFQEYFRVLGRNGLLLMHVSNKFLELVPVVYSNAREINAGCCDKSNEAYVHPDAEFTTWTALSRSSDNIGILADKMGWNSAARFHSLPRPWTDQYSNLLSAMIRR
jgi:hypothetical protein